MFNGEKIRQVRKEKGLTLQELARQTGLSSSLISQIERQRVDPTVSTFWKICSSLNIPFNFFFEGGSEENYVVRKNERRIVELAGANVKYHDLTPPNKSGTTDFILVEIQPGNTTEPELISHAGEECGYILKGTLKVFLGDKEFFLSEGDSICFPSTTPHRYINTGSEISISLWAMNSK